MPPSRNRPLWIFLSLWIAGSCLACGAGLAIAVWTGERIEETRRAREGSDALDVVQHDRLRFRLRRPLPSWTLLPEGEATLVDLDADAAAFDPNADAVATVSVRPAYGVHLPGATQAVIALYQRVGVELSSPVPTTIAGRDAVRLSGHGWSYGHAALIEVGLMVSEDHIYVICGKWPEDVEEPDALSDALFAAFELLGGPVGDPPPRVAPTDTHGPLWRIRGGDYESAAHGFRLRGGDGWVVLAGDDLQRTDWRAATAIARADLDMVLVVRPASAIGVDQPRVRGRLLGNTLQADHAEIATDRTHSVAGDDIAIAHYLTLQGITYERAHGVLFDDGRLLEILAFSPVLGALDTHLESALARIELLTDAERDAIELDSPGTITEQVTDETALRHGRFRAYPWGLAWTTPSPCWQGVIGAEAARQEDRALLVVECPRRGAAGALWIEERLEDLEGSPIHVRSILRSIRLSEDSSEPAEVDFGTTRATDVHGFFTIDGALLGYELRSLVIDDENVRWAVWYPVDAGEDAAREGLAALDAMGVDSNAPSEITVLPGLYEDRRLGFAVEDRASGVIFEETDVGGRWTISTDVARGHLDVYAVPVFDHHAARREARLIRSHASRYIDIAQPRESTGMLGGEPCDVVTWLNGSHVLRTVTHGNLVYAVASEGLTPEEDERWARAFRFVDP